MRSITTDNQDRCTTVMRPLAKRVTVPMNRRSTNEIMCEIRELSTTSFELPNINYRQNNGKMYRYVYGVTYHRLPLTVVKVNVQDENEPVLECGYLGQSDVLMPSEPVFVRRLPFDDNSAEDDGVLLVMVVIQFLAKVNFTF